MLESLNKGIDAVHFKLPVAPNFEKLLKGILTDYCRLSLSFENSTAAFESLKAVLEANGNRADKLEGAFFGLAKQDFQAAAEVFPKVYFGIKNESDKLIPQFVAALKQTLEVLEFDSKVEGLAFQIYLTNDYFENIAGFASISFFSG